MSVGTAGEATLARPRSAAAPTTPFATIDSAWSRTTRDPKPWPRLAGTIDTDVVVLGAGSTGLTTAHYLREAGMTCVVLEAAAPGWGCSGRSGGMVVARYKRGFAWLAKQYGHETVRLLHRWIVEGIDQIEALIAIYDIDCDFRRCGHLTAAHSKAGLAELAADIDWLRAEAGDRTPTLVDAAAVREGLGTSAYLGGYLDRRAGAIHQMDYVRGLARGLQRRGVLVFGDSAARECQVTERNVLLRTDDGLVKARHLVVATNAYTSLAPRVLDLERRIVPVNSSLFATEKLPPALAGTVMRAGWVVGDTKHLMNSFALLPGNRMLYGGRGDITGRSDATRAYASLERLFARTFPQLAGTKIEVRWSGMVAVTLDNFPHVGREGPVHYAIGCGGRGIVLSGIMGRALAQVIAGTPVDLGPMTRNPFRAVPFHGLRIPGMKLAANYYRCRDLLGI